MVNVRAQTMYDESESTADDDAWGLVQNIIDFVSVILWFIIFPSLLMFERKFREKRAQQTGLFLSLQCTKNGWKTVKQSRQSEWRRQKEEFQWTGKSYQIRMFW